MAVFIGYHSALAYWRFRTCYSHFSPTQAKPHLPHAEQESANQDMKRPDPKSKTSFPSASRFKRKRIAEEKDADGRT